MRGQNRARAMPARTDAARTIHVAAPIAHCQRFFTPAGEELWVDGWQPRYVVPPDGRTEAGMVFTTGAPGSDEYTVWTLLDWDTQAHVARYSRVTPASRCGVVEVRCRADGAAATWVDVRYTLTALTPAGNAALAAFEGDTFAAMIDGWQQAISQRLAVLLQAHIR